MLRLQPSQVALTKGEVAEYKRRSDYRLIARLVDSQGGSPEAACYESNDCSPLPRVQRGAQRYRDDAFTQSSTTYVPSSASSEVDGSHGGSSNFHAERDEHCTGDVVEGRKKDESAEVAQFRRDSVLSQEEGINSNALQSLEAVKSRNVSDISWEVAESERTEDSSRSIPGFRPNRPHSLPEAGEYLGLKSSDETTTARQGRASPGLYRSSALRRRFRPRSFSDPCDTPLQSLHLERARKRTSSMRVVDVQVPKGRTEHVQTIPESLSEEDPRQESGHRSSPTVGLDHKSSSIVSSRRDAIVTNDSHAANLSQPCPGFTESSSPTAGHGATPHLDHSQLQANDLARDRSAMLEALQDHISPLDALSEELTAYSSLTWIANLPVRPGNSTIWSDPRMPAFESTDTPPVQAPDAQFHRAESLAAGRQPQRPRAKARPSRPPSSSPGPVPSTYRPEAEAARQPQRRAMEWSLGRSIPPEFAVENGGRPSFGSLGHGSIRGPIRRRLVPRAEQENEEDMGQYEEERQERRARFAAAAGGVLERTPPPLGRLERYLR